MANVFDTFYSVYDEKAGSFTPPFLAKNDEVAKRVLIQSMRALPDCPLIDYPADFTLFAIGSWDCDNGIVTPFEVKRNIGNVLQIMSSFGWTKEETKEENE